MPGFMYLPETFLYSWCCIQGVALVFVRGARNRAWAQREFAAADIAEEVLHWLLAQSGVPVAPIGEAGEPKAEL